MQLAWFKTVDLYIGQGLVLLKLSPEETHIFEFPVTMPLDRALMKCNGMIQKGTKLRIALSSLLCSPLNVEIPPTVVNAREVNAILSACAAEQLHELNTEFAYSIDSNTKSLGAVIPVYTENILKTWAKQLKCSVTSLQPLWSIASRFDICKNTDINSFVLHEPDGSILIAETQDGRFNAVGWRESLSPELLKQNCRNSLIGLGLTEQNLIRFRFEARPINFMTPAPAAWPKHWSML